VRRSDILHNLVHPLLSGRRTLDGKKFPIDAKDDWCADFQMHIRGTARNRGFQDVMKQVHKTDIRMWEMSKAGEGKGVSY